MNLPRRLRVLPAIPVLISVFLVGAIEASAGPGPLVATGSMSTQRSGHTATLLSDGRVLIVGGETCLYMKDGGGCDFGGAMSLAGAEVYRPDTGSWSATGSLATSRYAHIATRLRDGTVLVAGGFYEPPAWSTDVPSYIASAELYDPQSGTWSATGSLAGPRGFAMAALLADGNVLVAGGTSGAVDVVAAALTTAEIYHPETGAWSATGSMAQAHGGGTMTRLNDGRILVAGGVTGAGDITQPETYDPISGVWTSAGAMVSPRAYHSATLLSDGTVLVTSGDGFSGGFEIPLNTAEIYAPSTGLWAATASTANTHFQNPNAVLLSDGTVLLADNVAEVYDPIVRSWAAATGTNASYGQSATRLNDGRVLIAGGCCDPISGLFLSSTQLYGAPGANADSVITATGRNVTTVEGGQLSGVIASFTDADPYGAQSQFSASVAWGDGTSSAGAISAGAGGFNVSGSHTYAEEGLPVITVSISDSGGAATSATSPATVGDATVAVTGAGAILAARVNVATTLTLGLLTDSDPGGVASDYGVTVAWGDGSSSAGSITFNGARFSLSGTHTYATKGQFAITLSASDRGGFGAIPVSDWIRVS